MIIVKLYLRLSLELLWTVWGQFIFRQFFGPTCSSQGQQTPSYVVGDNYRVLIYCTCHFQAVPSVYFSFFCLLVSSVSNFRPDPRGAVVVTFYFFQAHLFSHAVGGRNTGNKCHWRELALTQPHWVCPHSGVCAFTVYTAQAPGGSAGNCLVSALGCLHSPGLSRSGSGRWILYQLSYQGNPFSCAIFLLYLLL